MCASSCIARSPDVAGHRAIAKRDDSRIIPRSNWSGLQAERRMEKRDEAKTNAVNNAVLDPVSRVFVKIGQGLERTHPIEKQDAIEMIGLVLNHASRKIVEREARPPTPRSNPRTVISRARGTWPRMSGMLRQPSHPSTMSLPTGVISGLMIAIGSASGRRRRRRAYSAPRRRDGPLHGPAAPPGRRRGIDHRLDHVVDQPLNRRLPDLGAFERVRLGAQHGMSHARDLEDGHVRRIIPRR